MSFSESAPCSDNCTRARSQLGVDAPHETISRLLADNVAETAVGEGLFDTYNGTEQQEIADLVHSDRWMRPVGAALICARVIGRGECPAYLYNPETQTIEER